MNPGFRLAASPKNPRLERSERAELHQVRGDLLNAMGDGAAAEQNYHQALLIACPLGARVFERRATASLARLWRDQGKRTESKRC